MVYVVDALEFTYNSYFKLIIVAKFNLKFNKELKVFVAEIKESYHSFKNKILNLNLTFNQSENSKITSDLDSNTAS